MGATLLSAGRLALPRFWIAKLTRWTHCSVIASGVTALVNRALIIVVAVGISHAGLQTAFAVRTNLVYAT